MSDVQIVETETLPVLADPAPMPQAGPLNLFGADSPAEVVEKATEVAGVLKDILVQRNHIVNIGQGQHVKLEGWTTLGSMLGVMAVVTSTEKLEDGYMATAEARTLGGQVVGAANAVCLRSERSWKNRDDYALLSMSQTRACSKALRMPLGFIIELAGYNPTPADEMDKDSDTAATRGASTPVSDRGGVVRPNVDPSPPPLQMTDDMRLEDGSFPIQCPYCLGEVVEETKLIKKGTDAERDQIFTNCINNQCAAREWNGTMYPWSEFGSIEGAFKVGGRIDELVNAGHGPVENITPEFDAKEYLQRTMLVAENWSDQEKKEALTAAKAKVAHKRRWSHEVAQMVALEALDVYWRANPTSDSKPF